MEDKAWESPKPVDGQIAIMLKGTNIPKGWLLADGKNGTPNLNKNTLDEQYIIYKIPPSNIE